MTDDDALDLAGYIRSIPDFPTPGIVLQGHHAAARRAPRRSTPRCASSPSSPAALDADVVIGAEARGFLLGPALARELGAGFVLARKPGKLPHDTVSAKYALEYGTDALELHVRRRRGGRARARPRRPAGHRRHGARALPARRAARRRGRRLRVSHRARASSAAASCSRRTTCTRSSATTPSSPRHGRHVRCRGP